MEILVYMKMPEYTAFEVDEPDDWIILEKIDAKAYTFTNRKAKKNQIVH